MTAASNVNSSIFAHASASMMDYSSPCLYPAEPMHAQNDQSYEQSDVDDEYDDDLQDEGSSVDDGSRYDDNDSSGEKHVQVIPRRKRGEPADVNRKGVKLGISEIKEYFHMRQSEAAKRLGISLTAMKSACRRIGLTRWPYARRKKARTKVLAGHALPAHGSYAASLFCDSAPSCHAAPLSQEDNTASSSLSDGGFSSSNDSPAPLEVQEEVETPVLPVDGGRRVEEAPARGGLHEVGAVPIDKGWIEWFVRTSDSMEIL